MKYVEGLTSLLTKMIQHIIKNNESVIVIHPRNFKQLYNPICDCHGKKDRINGNILFHSFFPIKYCICFLFPPRIPPSLMTCFFNPYDRKWLRFALATNECIDMRWKERVSKRRRDNDEILKHCDSLILEALEINDPLTLQTGNLIAPGKKT